MRLVQKSTFCLLGGFMKNVLPEAHVFEYLVLSWCAIWAGLEGVKEVSH